MTPTKKPGEAPHHQTASQTGPTEAASLHPAKSPPLGAFTTRCHLLQPGGPPGWGRGSPTANQAHLPEGFGATLALKAAPPPGGPPMKETGPLPTHAAGGQGVGEQVYFLLPVLLPEASLGNPGPTRAPSASPLPQI